MKPGRIYWTFIGICFILISLWAGICENDRERLKNEITMASPDGLSETETDIKNEEPSANILRTRFSEDEFSPRVAVSFDDGPHARYTPMLLDGLKERDVKATFFLIGENIPGNEEIVKRMSEEGHLIGNHTYNHVKITDLSETAACEEITKTSELVRNITGMDTAYIRPPFGEWDKRLECRIDLFPVLWTVDTRDWTTKNVGDVVRRGTSGIKDGDVILLHDCYDSSVKAALEIVDCLKKEGFVFVTADELILE